jgi:hypothetical protein
MRRFAVWRNGHSARALRVDAPALGAARRAFLIAVALIWFRVPFWIFFLVNLVWLNREAKHQYEEVSFPIVASHRWQLIGLFPVKGVRAGLSGIEFELPVFGTLKYYDLPCYSGDKHLIGNWYTDDHTRW